MLVNIKELTHTEIQMASPMKRTRSNVSSFCLLENKGIERDRQFSKTILGGV